MAQDQIVINTGKRLGATTVSAGDLLRQLCDTFSKLSNIVGHCDNGTDHVGIESAFGLATGAGGNFATLVTLMNNIFNTNTEVTGAARLSQINEFIGRISGQ